MPRRMLLVMCALLATAAPASALQQAPADSSALPAGFGTLRQDDIAVKVQVGAVQVRVLPLDEQVIRTLSPDSYRTLHELRDSKRKAIDEVLRRTGLPGASLWYVQFYNLEQGEARFSPMELVINSAGRPFRAVELFALTSGFGEQRLRQRETQAALYIFDPAVDISQPLTIAFETQSSAAWETLLKKVDRERTMIRSRASAKPGQD
ncbi:MAG: hypothetical protein HYV19_12900 [Gemmatimonadetes bacterium]|nr:hypothetical protein [Gemmatimonadota bacterium]